MSFNIRIAAVLALAAALPSQAWAQAPVVATTANQQSLLASKDPKLAANKKLVFDMWRTILEAGHVEQADKFLSEDYIQHNPNVASGRATVVEFFSKMLKKKPIENSIPGLVSIVAERDLVVMSFVREYPDPKDSAKTYTTTWFDMFRVENGVIVEHWDSSPKF
ncbi:MAG: hypothetical protein BGP16_14325 [Sphingobium sp. 66-54]|nr:MAG: hypothetical protein BGP16_14325 [Sphingobium sp. 66-54]